MTTMRLSFWCWIHWASSFKLLGFLGAQVLLYRTVGFQLHHQFHSHLKVSLCCKHQSIELPDTSKLNLDWCLPLQYWTLPLQEADKAQTEAMGRDQFAWSELSSSAHLRPWILVPALTTAISCWQSQRPHFDQC